MNSRFLLSLSKSITQKNCTTTTTITRQFGALTQKSFGCGDGDVKSSAALAKRKTSVRLDEESVASIFFSNAELILVKLILGI